MRIDVQNLLKIYESLETKHFGFMEDSCNYKKNYILDLLDKVGLNYDVQKFKSKYPLYYDWELICDGKVINCFPCCVEEGESTSFIIRNVFDFFENYPFGFDFSKNYVIYSNITKGLPISLFIKKVSCQVAYKDVKKIVNSKSLKFFVDMDIKKGIFYNIIVGNVEDSDFVVEAHYDTVVCGFEDNLLAVSFLLYLLSENIIDVDKNLIIFSCCEEINVDMFPNYWTYGAIVLADKYKDVLREKKSIKVIDMIIPRMNKINVIKKGEFFFDETNARVFYETNEKTFLISSYDGDFNTFYKYYHSNLDTSENCLKNINERDFENFLKNLYSILFKN